MRCDLDKNRIGEREFLTIFRKYNIYLISDAIVLISSRW